MPRGMQGFQPGRKKTGGRTKGEPTKAQLTNAFKDRLKKHGFDFDKELAKALRLLCQGKPANQYPELKALLPFTYPKLKEIDPPAEDAPSEQNTQMTTEQLLEAMSGKSERPIKAGTDPVSTVETRRPDLQIETDSEGTVPGLVGEPIEE